MSKSTQEKLKKILRAIYHATYFENINKYGDAYNVNDPECKPKMKRYALRRAILGAFDYPLERHTVYKYFDFLIAKGYISPNPTSEFQSVQVAPEYCKKKHMPNDDSKYFVHLSKIYEVLQNSEKKVTTHPSSQTSLSGFNEQVVAPKETNNKNCASVQASLYKDANDKKKINSLF